MTSFRVVERDEQPTAVIRERVPMIDLPDFFSRAFSEAMTVILAQGAHPSGPPFGKYYGRPGAFVDVEAGFPVSSPIEPADSVVPGSLPGGHVAEAVHVGSYETIGDTYARLERDMHDADLTPGAVMWESYLTDPGAESDPTKWRTQICWPLD